MEEYDFSSGEAGASDTVPMEAGQIKRGGMIMIKGQPCKVSDVSTSKTGKHGHSKCHFTAYNIFNNKKLEDLVPSSHNTSVPIVTRKDYNLISIDDEDYMTLMDEEGNTREDIKLPNHPEKYSSELRKAFDTKQLVVTVLKCCGKEQVVSHKEE